MRLTVNGKVQGEEWLLGNTLLLKEVAQWVGVLGVDALGPYGENVILNAPLGTPLANSILAIWGNGPKDGQDLIVRVEGEAGGYNLTATKYKWR